MNFDVIQDALWQFIFDKGPDIVGALLVLVIGFILLKVALKIFDKVVARTKLNKSIAVFLRSAIKIAGIVLILITVATTLGIPAASLVTVLGTVGLAVSLAVKDSLANAMGGIMVLMNKSFQIGDVVEINGVLGSVAEIGIIHTTINTPDNRRVYVPNSSVANATIINVTAEATRRLDLEFSIGYADDIEKAKAVILSVVSANKMAILDPAPVIGVASHGASAVNIACKVWVETANYADLSLQLHEQIKVAFDKEGISIPFNQLDVHVTNN